MFYVWSEKVKPSLVLQFLLRGSSSGKGRNNGTYSSVSICDARITLMKTWNSVEFGLKEKLSYDCIGVCPHLSFQCDGLLLFLYFHQCSWHFRGWHKDFLKAVDFNKSNYREPPLANSHTGLVCPDWMIRSIAIAWPAHVILVLTHTELWSDNSMVAEFESMWSSLDDCWSHLPNGNAHAEIDSIMQT